MAEENTNTNVDTNANPDNNGIENPNGNADGEAKKEPSVEELLTQIAQLKADGIKNKNALDKALKEKGEITKRLREKQTAEEAEAEAKAEAESERAEREAEKDKIIAKYEAEKRFLAMGINGDLLDKIVTADTDGDKDTVYSLIAKFYEDKAEASIKAKQDEWLGNRPPVNVGVDNGNTLTKAQFSKMGYSARVKLATENPTLYAQLTS